MVRLGVTVLAILFLTCASNAVSTDRPDPVPVPEADEGYRTYRKDLVLDAVIERTITQAATLVGVLKEFMEYETYGLSTDEARDKLLARIATLLEKSQAMLATATATAPAAKE